MKRLLRGVIDYGTLSTEALAYNYQRLRTSKVQWVQPEDEKIFRFVSDFFESELDLPAGSIIADFFKRSGDVEAEERLKDIEAAQAYEGANYSHVLKGIIEDQGRMKIMTIFKEAQEVATKGLLVGEGKAKERVQGVEAAILYFQRSASELLQGDNNARTRGEIRSAAMEVKQEYLAAKANPGQAFGCFSGIEVIDNACHGLKRGELWTHAAFTGELKCLPQDAWVYDHTQNKRRTIGSIAASKDLPVVTALYREGAEWKLVKAPVSQMRSNGIRPVYDLALESGRRIGATDNHPFYTLDGWKKLGDLRVGDWVGVPKRSLRSTDRAPSFTDAEVSLVGYLLGDGSLSNNFSFTAHNREVMAAFQKHLVESGYVEGLVRSTGEPSYIFRDEGHTLHISKNPGSSQFHANLPVSPLRLLLEGLGLWGCTSYTKKIPDEFYGLPESQVRLLLGALWSTDGSCHAGDHVRKDRSTPCRRNDITYASVSLALCQGVQALLLQLGIQSTVLKTNSTYEGEPYVFYTVRVVTASAKRRFVEAIHVVGKTTQFSLLSGRLQVSEKEDDRVPTALVPSGIKVRIGNSYRYSSQLVPRGTMGLDLATKLAPHAPTVRRHLEGDLNWERVTSIDYRGDEETWDLEVPEHHSLVVNDIVTHNTTFALCWAYNQATRYRRNVFYASLEMPFRQVRNILCVLHSAHPRWILQGRTPLDYRKVRDGELSDEEEEFFFEVLDDFFSNDEYCRLELWCPDHDVTIADVKMEVELLHKQTEIGFCVIDHGGLVKGQKKNGQGTTEELNEVMRSAKTLALHFNHGEGLPVLLLFQLNRQGKDDAEKNKGRYKMKALSYSNECERSSDYVTTTYLDDQLREAGRTIFCCLKNRDNPHFPPFEAGVDFTCRRIFNLDPGESMTSETSAEEMNELLNGV